MKKGSITVFTSLCMMFVMSALFIFMEAARMYGLDEICEWKVTQSTECIAAEYQPYVWQKYHLLMLDGGYGTEEFDIGKMAEKLRYNMEQNTADQGMGELFHVRLNAVYQPDYLLLTDQQGEVFLDMVASYMKNNFPAEIADKLYQRYKGNTKPNQDSEVIERKIDDARDLLDRARKENEEKTLENTEEYTEAKKSEDNITENPLEIVSELKKSMQFSAVNVVIQSPEELSRQRVDFIDQMECRDLEEGTMSYESQGDWYRKILTVEYADSYFTSYTRQEIGHALAYELEYLIGGKSEDRENLESVIKRLLTGRLAANVTSLLSDYQKREEVKGVAVTLAGFTGNAAIIKTVEIAVTGAWAYAESIQDLRRLLDGGKIALIKSSAQWTTDLLHLTEALKKEGKAKECTNGFSYQEYLKMLLYQMEENKFAYRMLDIMEQNLMRTEGEQKVRMDHMIVSFKCKMQYAAEPLFSTMSVLKIKDINSYLFYKEKKFTYRL